MKGAIKPDHMPVNNYQLLILGFPPLTFTKISGLEDEIEKAKMPDRTVASGGNRAASEIVASMPLHHKAEQLIMETWFRESQDPVLPTYKKTGTLIVRSISGLVVSARALSGVWPFKRKDADMEMDNEGEIALVEWSISIDDVKPLP